MVIALLVFGGLVFAAVFVVLVFAGVFKTERDQASAERNATEILDKAFDGRPDVTFTTNMRSLKAETVVLGAKQRGYKLASQIINEYGYGPLIFEKVEQAAPPAVP